MVLCAPYPTAQGSQVYVRGMARALAARGHGVTVVSYDLAAPGAALDCDRGLAYARAPVPGGYSRLRSGPDAWKPWLDWRVLRTLRSVDAELLHAHNVEGLAVALADGRPVLYANHGLLADELPTYFVRGQVLARALGAAFDATLPRRAAAVQAISEHAASALRARGSTCVQVVLPAIDPADFAGAEVREPRPRVVYCGNTDRYQGLDALPGVAALLPAVEVVAVTTVPVELAGVRNVVAPRWEEARGILAEAGATVIPRIVPGGFPMKLLNSLALGVPTVVTPALAQGLPGEFVARSGAPGDLSTALAAAIATPLAERRRISATIHGDHCWSARVPAIEALYDAIAPQFRYTSAPRTAP
jgi:glycosyltransferase involved in cell wall biosynthesis